MAHIAQDGVKEKISAVREIVPGYSNNAITLVLQYYDYSVQEAIQAFLEDGAKQALTEWHFQGNKINTKKKKKNKAKKSDQSGDSTAQASTNGDQGQSATAQTVPGPSTITESSIGNNSTVLNGHDPALESDGVKGRPGLASNQLSGNDSTKHAATTRTKPEPIRTNQDSTKTKPEVAKSKANILATQKTQGEQSSQQSVRPKALPVSSIPDVPVQRERIGSSVSTTSTLSTSSAGRVRRPHAGLEKSMKDLQRQTISLLRFRNLLNEEVERSFKRIKTVHEELHKCLKEREAELVQGMENVKSQATTILNERQERAAELKVRTDRAPSMSEQELAELRADIKHFVTDRKIDEEVGRTTRFLYDTDHLCTEIRSFGEIAPVRSAYSTRRPSVTSICSSVSHDELMSPLTPLTPHTPVFDSLTSSLNTKTTADQNNLSVLDSGAMAIKKAMEMEHNAKTDTISVKEVVELQERLNNSLKLQGLPVKSPPSRKPRVQPVEAKPNERQENTGDKQKTRSAKRRELQRKKRLELKSESEKSESGKEQSSSKSSSESPNRNTPNRRSKSPGKRSQSQKSGPQGEKAGSQGDWASREEKAKQDRQNREYKEGSEKVNKPRPRSRSKQNPKDTRSGLKAESKEESGPESGTKVTTSDKSQSDKPATPKAGSTNNIKQETNSANKEPSNKNDKHNSSTQKSSNESKIQKNTKQDSPNNSRGQNRRPRSPNKSSARKENMKESKLTNHEVDSTNAEIIGKTSPQENGPLKPKVQMNNIKDSGDYTTSNETHDKDKTIENSPKSNSPKKKVKSEVISILDAPVVNGDHPGNIDENMNNDKIDPLPQRKPRSSRTERKKDDSLDKTGESSPLVNGDLNGVHIEVED